MFDLERSFHGVIADTSLFAVSLIQICNFTYIVMSFWRTANDEPA